MTADVQSSQTQTMCFTDHHMCPHIETHTHIQIISTFNSSAKESWEWQSVTSQLYSTLQFTFWPLWSSGQPSEVDSTGIMINPILQMWKVRLRGVNTGLYFSVDSAELGWGSCLAQCCFITDFLVQTEMCRDSGWTLWSRWVLSRSRLDQGQSTAILMPCPQMECQQKWNPC